MEPAVGCLAGGGYGEDWLERIRGLEMVGRGRAKMGRERRAGYGNEKNRSDRIRDWEQLERGQEKMSRERERDKKERDLSSSKRERFKERDLSRNWHRQQHAQQRLFAGGASGEVDKSVSQSIRPPLAGSTSAGLSIPQNSSDSFLDRESSSLGAGRTSGAKQLGKDADREPRELRMCGRRVEETNWRLDISMSLHNALRQPVEMDGKRRPTKIRKLSPIFWDYDEKQARPSISPRVSSASPVSVLNSFVIQTSAAVHPHLLSSPSVYDVILPLSNLPSSGQATPPGSANVHGVQGLSSSPQGSTLWPILEQTLYSPFVEERNNEPDILGIQMLDQVMPSPMLHETEQLLPDLIESLRTSPSEVKYDEEKEIAPPSITIAACRWSRETNTPGLEKSPRAGGGKRLASIESEHGRVSLGQDGEHLKSGPSTSPEPGEYIREKVEPAPRVKEGSSDRDGRLGQGCGGKDRRRDSIEDKEFERELHLGELELEEDSPLPRGPRPRAVNMLQGCRSVDEFERLNRIGEGTYGVVYRARNKKTREIVALKRMKMENVEEGFPINSLREINILFLLHHPSVVDVKEVVVGSTVDSIFVVMEYMEHTLSGLMKTMEQPFLQSKVKSLMLQLFEGVKYLHDNCVLHRDLKTSNLLLNNQGELKICDFGLSRLYGSRAKAYTHMVVTLWYRAPELLLLNHCEYSTAIDMWSLGCIMAEFLAKEPLFDGKSELDQIHSIFKTLGTPDEKIWPEFASVRGVNCKFVPQKNKLRERFPGTAFSGRPALSKSGFDLLNRLLAYDPQKRITAEEALKHDWFREEPLPKP